MIPIYTSVTYLSYLILIETLFRIVAVIISEMYTYIDVLKPKFSLSNFLHPGKYRYWITSCNAMVGDVQPIMCVVAPNPFTMGHSIISVHALHGSKCLCMKNFVVVETWKLNYTIILLIAHTGSHYRTTLFGSSALHHNSIGL